jgi:hypothetical protein
MATMSAARIRSVYRRLNHAHEAVMRETVVDAVTFRTATRFGTV